MKKIMMLLLAVLFLFAGCSNTEPPKESEVTQESQAQVTEIKETLDAETKTLLTDSAKYLTKAVAASSSGFSSNVNKPSENVVLPNARNQNDVAKFLINLMSCTNPNEKIGKTIYSKSIYMDNNQMYHLNKAIIPVVLKDVLNVSEYKECLKILEEQLSFKTDEKNNEYLSGLEFGAGSDWYCKEISNVKIDESKNEIIVEYKVENEFAFAGGDKEEITAYNCKNVFEYNKNDADEFSLNLKSAEILKAVKSTNPDA